MLRVAVLGYGHWGPNLVRNLATGERTRVTAIADPAPARRQLAQSHYPQVRVLEDAAAAIRDPEVDAIAIATPIVTHHELARRALLAGKHVLVEKPLAASVAEAEELACLAADARRVLMVDHTLVYTAAVRELRELVAAGALGRVLHLDSVRINAGARRPDGDVLWDLAAHDLTVMDHVLAQPLGTRMRWISATGTSYAGRHENVAYLAVGFDDGLFGHVHVSSCGPVKTRRMTVAGTRRMVLWDDTAPVERLKVYEGPSEGRALELDGREALAVMAQTFAAACLDGAPSPSDAAVAVRIVRMLAAAQHSLQHEGARVPL